ncbi:MAG: hypothetical protein KIH62_002670 [Candidatus Kerfeldbacteria bacterium]|nr:hypothetical protein [Candidatus Kerfeldbacteria bacterium]
MWTLTCGLVFGATYYSLRQGANDPQLQMVRDMRNSLNNGALAESFQQNVNPVDIKNSLSPFYMIFSEDHTVLASSGRLNNETLQVPSGVLEYVVNSAPSMVGGAEYRVTLEPQKGVRLAAVFKVAPLNTPGAQHHIVMAARNLIEVDSRIQYIQWVCAGVWLAGLLAIAGYSALSQRPEKRTA